MRRTKLKDIAQYTQMSMTAVSLVLNNKPCKLSEGSKQKILRAAKELTYSPNRLAVGLATRRTHTIGLIINDISNVFFSIFAKGVDRACQEAGYNVMLCNSWNTHEGDLHRIDALADSGVEGIIYCMSDDTTVEQAEESKTKLQQYGIPFVEVDSNYTENYIRFDNEQGGYLATRYLIEQGHRQIACITGPAQMQGINGRVSGYRRAYKEAGLPFNSNLLVEGDFSMESGVAAVKKLLGQTFTAVFACNDMMAIGALKELQANRIRVPQDVSLVGYDDVPISEMLEVPLTTIRQPTVEMGVSAAQILIGILKEPEKKVEPKVFLPRLIVRKSVCNRTVENDETIQ